MIFGQTGGGIAPAIVGTFMLVSIATAISLPIGVLIAIYVSEFAPKPFAEQVKLWLDVLNGFPSIVIGIFVFALAVKTKVPVLGIGHHQSAWAGGYRAVDHHAPARRADDDGGARARAEQPPRGELRARRLEVAHRPQRGAPECARRHRHRDDACGRARRRRDGAAPLHLRLRLADGLDWDPSKPVSSIPYTIFSYSERPIRHLHAQAWAAAFILITFVLVTSLVARLMLDRSRRKLGQSRVGPDNQFVTRSTQPLSPSSPRRLGTLRPTHASHPRTSCTPKDQGDPDEEEGTRPSRARDRCRPQLGHGCLCEAERRLDLGRREQSRRSTRPAVDAALGSAYGYSLTYACVGSGTGIAADHCAHGRFRCLGRAADRVAGRGVQRLRRRCRGRSPRPPWRTTSRATCRASFGSTPPRSPAIYIGSDHELERSRRSRS